MKALIFLLAVPLVLAVHISEVMYNPPGNDNNREYVEVFVPNGERLDNWTIADAQSGDTLVLLTYVNSTYAMIVEEGYVYDKENASASYYSAGATIGNGLNNDRDEVYLYDPSGDLVDWMEYDGSLANGNNRSLEFCNGSWQESAEGGTPGCGTGCNIGNHSIPAEQTPGEEGAEEPLDNTSAGCGNNPDDTAEPDACSESHCCNSGSDESGTASNNQSSASNQTSLNSSLNNSLANVSMNGSENDSGNCSTNDCDGTMDDTIVGDMQPNTENTGLENSSSGSSGVLEGSSGNGTSASEPEACCDNDSGENATEPVQAEQAIHACNVSISLSKRLFDEGEKVSFRVLAEPSAGFIIRYWIEDLSGKTVKSLVESANMNQRSWTPPEGAGAFIIFAEMSHPNCTDRGASELIAVRIVAPQTDDSSGDCIGDGIDAVSIPDNSSQSEPTAVQCGISISLSRRLFDQGEKVSFKVLAEPTKDFIVRYWIEDLSGKTVKKAVESTNMNQRSWTPPKQPGTYIILAELIHANCSDTGASELIAVRGEATQAETDPSLVIEPVQAQVKAGAFVQARLQAYRGSSKSSVVEVYLTDGKKRLTETAKLQLEQNSGVSAALPLYVKSDLASGNYTLVAEGLGFRSAAAVSVSGPATARQPAAAKQLASAKSAAIKSFYTLSRKYSPVINLYATLEHFNNTRLVLLAPVKEIAVNDTKAAFNASVVEGSNSFMLALLENTTVVDLRELSVDFPEPQVSPETSPVQTPGTRAEVARPGGNSVVYQTEDRRAGSAKYLVAGMGFVLLAIISRTAIRKRFK